MAEPRPRLPLNLVYIGMEIYTKGSAHARRRVRAPIQPIRSANAAPTGPTPAPASRRAVVSRPASRSPDACATGCGRPRGGRGPTRQHAASAQ